MSQITSATAPLVSAEDYLESNNRKKYSLSRLLLRGITPQSKDSCLENEISDDLRLKSKNSPSKGFLVPPTALGLRSVSTDNTGANLIATSNSDFFNFVPEPKSEVLKLGGQLVTGLRDDYSILGTNNPFNAYYVDERSQIPVSNPNVSKIEMKPHKLAVLCPFTVEMLRQAPEFADRYIAEGLQRALARKLDETVFTGTGINQPLGLISHPEVNSIVLGANGGNPNWSSIVEMEKLVTDNNPIADEAMAYFVNSETESYLKKTEKVSGSGEFLMVDQPLLPLDEIKILNSRRAVVTNNLPSNLSKGTSVDLSAMVFGDWSQIVIGFWGAIALDINPYSNENFSKGLVTVRLLAMVDIAILNPQLFCVATDVKTNN